MSDFDTRLREAAEKAALHAIAGGAWLQPDYASRLKVPPDLLKAAWEMIDVHGLKAKLAARIESELVDRIVNHMAAEIATDIKQILSVKERREAIRHIAREHMEAIMKAA